jgi:hypothetical protein
MAMLERTNSLFGIYLNFKDLRHGVDELKKFRFRNNDISVLFPEAAVSKTLPDEPGPHAPAVPVRAAEPLIGGTLGWLTYINPTSVGVVSEALVGLGVPAYDAERYETRIRNGALLVCVRCLAGLTKGATEILARTGAKEINLAKEPAAAPSERITAHGVLGRAMAFQTAAHTRPS